ncbi:hypothetical protein HUZ36_12885 [Pseudoalteromonas sp. McH1-7]|uniref:Carrier domain-containing protein n=1 Tax=Pseudoalteromonas peptidolytica F12-50-A1 TaxID=1315280 RepID=A0A8I0MXN9_9GAMM|nr:MULTISPECIES: phosphopantetheine-binding protein [Pseudoalteromonas]MBE0346964.1 hypothetical protein [Pseudoalteromonas peptidolytica F12-50-A1]MDW7550125.1 phosphopantetheine-binding protein [Pseudoalteromonas peptidolytica]NLR14021.1 hypothetical protein [Pseudoalteromonas peptidolytica]NUZ11675.1 hypothetical protein [Pseudoalteromonas sp. McH1-7]RRS06780.1 hypothetical protein EAG18_20440 [Pseudoalteromonas sp. J010]
MSNLESITQFIKQDIIVDNLEVVDSIEEIEDDAPLIGDGLDLDSIEVLDLVVSIEKQYSLKFKDYPEQTIQEKMKNVATLAQFVHEQVAAKATAEAC